MKVQSLPGPLVLVFERPCKKDSQHYRSQTSDPAPSGNTQAGNRCTLLGGPFKHLTHRARYGLLKVLYICCLWDQIRTDPPIPFHFQIPPHLLLPQI